MFGTPRSISDGGSRMYSSGNPGRQVGGRYHKPGALAQGIGASFRLPRIPRWIAPCGQKQGIVSIRCSSMRRMNFSLRAVEHGGEQNGTGMATINPAHGGFQLEINALGEKFGLAGGRPGWRCEKTRIMPTAVPSSPTSGADARQGTVRRPDCGREGRPGSRAGGVLHRLFDLGPPGRPRPQQTCFEDAGDRGRIAFAQIPERPWGCPPCEGPAPSTRRRNPPGPACAR